MVIGTNKNLDSVEIECIQMHSLNGSLIATDTVFGCMDANAINFDENANFEPSDICFYVDNFRADGCAFPYLPGEEFGLQDIIDYATNYSPELAYEGSDTGGDFEPTTDPPTFISCPSSEEAIEFGLSIPSGMEIARTQKVFTI